MCSRNHTCVIYVESLFYWVWAADGACIKTGCVVFVVWSYWRWWFNKWIYLLTLNLGNCGGFNLINFAIIIMYMDVLFKRAFRKSLTTQTTVNCIFLLKLLFGILIEIRRRNQAILRLLLDCPDLLPSPDWAQVNQKYQIPDDLTRSYSLWLFTLSKTWRNIRRKRVYLKN